MDNRENLWTRRSNTSKLSLSTSQSDHQSDHPPSRTFSATAKRFGGDTSSHGGRNPFNAISPLTPGALASPTTGGSSAFGLGSGAFASFGSANKTPKTPGTAFDFKTAATPATVPTTPAEKKPPTKIINSARKEPASIPVPQDNTPMSSEPLDPSAPWPLKYTWVVWFRPPTPKNNDYEKSMKALCRMSTAQDFWKVFVHLKRPSSLPTVSDYHVFKEGIRPVWEDEENKRGGKWIMRLKKGVADRYWEELLMACIGDQFNEAGEEVCGFVLSVRSGEDVFSIWTKNDGGRNIKIRETVKRVLGLPEGTQIIWRSHDDSIAQRTAIDQARQEKNHLNHEKRRVTSSDESQREKSTAGSLPWDSPVCHSAKQPQKKVDRIFKSKIGEWLESTGDFTNMTPNALSHSLDEFAGPPLRLAAPARYKALRLYLEDPQRAQALSPHPPRLDGMTSQSLGATIAVTSTSDTRSGSGTSCEATGSTAGDSQRSSDETTNSPFSWSTPNSSGKPF